MKYANKKKSLNGHFIMDTRKQLQHILYAVGDTKGGINDK